MKVKCNKELREYIKKNNIKHFEIADRMGIYESKFSIMLRHEMPNNEKIYIYSYIAEILIERIEQEEIKKMEQEKQNKNLCENISIMQDAQKTYNVNVRLSEKESRLVDALCMKYKTNRSDVIRMALQKFEQKI